MPTTTCADGLHGIMHLLQKRFQHARAVQATAQATFGPSVGAHAVGVHQCDTCDYRVHSPEYIPDATTGGVDVSGASDLDD